MRTRVRPIPLQPRLPALTDAPPPIPAEIAPAVIAALVEVLLASARPNGSADGEVRDEREDHR